MWLTQRDMSELFQTTPQNITQHIAAIFEEGELVESATCKGYLQVQMVGNREVLRVREAVKEPNCFGGTGVTLRNLQRRRISGLSPKKIAQSAWQLTKRVNRINYAQMPSPQGSGSLIAFRFRMSVTDF